MLEIGVTVLVRLMVWFALVHFCLTLGSCGHGLILVVVICWFHLIRELWSGGGLLIILLFLAFWWCDCDSLVDEWSDSGGGVVLGESWGEDPVWLGWWLLYLMWIMEFGLTVWLWLCRRAAGRGSWYYWCSSVDAVKLILNIDWSLWWLVDSLSLRLCFDGWLVGWVMNDEWWMMIRCFGDRWFVVSVAVYLLLVTWCSCSLTLCVT